VLVQLALGSERGRDRREEQLGLGQRLQRHPEDAVGEVLDELGRGLECKPRLTRPAGTGHGDQARALADDRDQLFELALPADQGRGLRWQVGRVERAKRREIALAQLVELDRLAEVLEPVQPEIDK